MRRVGYSRRCSIRTAQDCELRRAIEPSRGKHFLAGAPVAAPSFSKTDRCLDVVTQDRLAGIDIAAQHRANSFAQISSRKRASANFLSAWTWRCTNFLKPSSNAAGYGKRFPRLKSRATRRPSGPRNTAARSRCSFSGTCLSTQLPRSRMFESREVQGATMPNRFRHLQFTLRSQVAQAGGASDVGF